MALAARGYSPGCLDGALGYQTRAALRAFQASEALPITGGLDPSTRERLRLAAPPMTKYVVTPNDLARLEPPVRGWLARSEQPRLDYATLLELVAEQAHAHPALVRRLNPGLDWTNAAPGTLVVVPNVATSPPRAGAAVIQIHLGSRMLEAFDAHGALLLHCPCSIARNVEKRPLGVLHVVAVVRNPDYTFDPANFPESAEARQLGHKLRLPPGPRNPVGTVWIGLDRPGYGIHGTPAPENIGRTESHGCFRLTNWDAEALARLVTGGLPVIVEP